MIIDSSGIILTNNHVVRGGGRVTVRLHDGREFDAVDVGTDPKTDVAVIRIDGAGDLPAAELGNSDSVNVGDWVMAVGAPFGLNETVTAGIISAKSRGIGITAREDFLQTDAAINPGNSGGPLVNLNGEVVGINTAISSTSGGYQGIGFAIPINLARWVGDQLTLTGHVERAFLGIGIQQITDELTDHFGLSAIEGVVVTAVRPDSPAAQAGLLAGDVIVEFDGRAVGAPRELQGIVERAAINAEHAVVVIRDEKRVKLNVRVATMPENVSVGTRAADGATFEQLGLELSGLDADVAKQLGLTDVTGVVITGVRPRSPAARAGLRTSMVITQVNRQAVKSPDDFERVLQAESDSDGVLLLIRDASGSRFVVVPRG